MNQGMLPHDLTKTETLRYLYEGYVEKHDRRPWHDHHLAFLKDVREATASQLANGLLRVRLWTDNPVSSPGQAPIYMKRVVEDRGLAEWIGSTAKMPLPPRGSERIIALEKVFGELCAHVKPLVSQPGKQVLMPWQLIRRVMAALFPEDVSCVISESRLQTVGKAMFYGLSKEEKNHSTVLLSARIVDRLDDALGESDGTLDQLVLRGHFVWYLYKTSDRGN